MHKVRVTTGSMSSMKLSEGTNFTNFAKHHMLFVFCGKLQSQGFVKRHDVYVFLPGTISRVLQNGDFRVPSAFIHM